MSELVARAAMLALTIVVLAAAFTLVACTAILAIHCFDQRRALKRGRIVAFDARLLEPEKETIR